METDIPAPARSRTAVANFCTLGASDDPLALPSICDASCVNAVFRASPDACSAPTKAFLTEAMLSDDRPLDRSS